METDNRKSNQPPSDDVAQVIIQRLTDISTLFHALAPVLYEAGLSPEKYQMPTQVGTRIGRLTRVYTALEAFSSGEAVSIFKAACKLHPPGVLRLWADDPNMRSAVDVKVYIQARQLLLQTWHSNVTLKSFFKVVPKVE